MSEVDHGARCYKHVGEAFRPRCYDCDAAASEGTQVGLGTLMRKFNCSVEQPCDRCIRARREETR